MKIIYFSSTGNSLFVAKSLGGELLPVPRLQKNGVYEITGDVVGIICPVYGFTLPNLVKEYLEKAVIKAEYVFAVMTFGGFSMAALTRMKKLLTARGVQLHYANEIKMVDTYLPLFEIAGELKKKKEESIALQINAVANDIKERKQYLARHNWLQKFISNVFSALWENKKAVNKRDKNFRVDDLCNACGTCRKVCPTGNIAGSGKPVYQHACEFCLACIHLCPQNAIHLKNERSAKRFRNPQATLAEIINANNQR
ncbi:MAG: EFR1 family ferrodoxin [Treponema sp.]|nr:EFR1 family ferrodoxin [Treponema sp.]